jgi:hypothetical protein
LTDSPQCARLPQQAKGEVAIVEGLTLVTKDELVRRYAVPTAWD